MSGKFNEPRLMGNCENCYYATRKLFGNCVCARYPKWVDVADMDNHFCGEFAWNNAHAERPRGEGEGDA